MTKDKPNFYHSNDDDDDDDDDDDEDDDPVSYIVSNLRCAYYLYICVGLHVHLLIPNMSFKVRSDS